MATDTTAPSAVRPGSTVGTLPTAVRVGAVLTLLAAVAAVVMLFLPVDPTLSSAQSDQLDSPVYLHCGSVVSPSGDDVLGKDGGGYSGAPGQVCTSARITRGGWAVAVLGGGIVVLVFSMLIGDGTAGPGRPAVPSEPGSPEPTHPEPAQPESTDPVPAQPAEPA